MENSNKQFDPLLKKIEDISTISIELWRLKTIQKGIDIGSTIISKSISFIFLFLGIVFLSIGVAIYIGTLLPNMYYGFGIVALFYLFIFVVLTAFGSSIKKCLANNLTKVFFN